jgi:hypothetical protein
LLQINSYDAVGYCEAGIWEDSHAGIDVASRGCLMKLSMGDVVNVVGTDYGSARSYGTSANGETTFRGYLYSPVQGIQVAWSVHKKGAVSTGGNELINFTSPYILFTSGSSTSSPYQTSSSTVTIPTAGIYYVEIVLQTNSGKADMRLVLNTNTILTRLVTNYTGTSYVTRSRSLLRRFAVNDTLQVMCENCDITGDFYEGISFMGLLLYAN